MEQISCPDCGSNQIFNKTGNQWYCAGCKATFNGPDVNSVGPEHDTDESNGHSGND